MGACHPVPLFLQQTFLCFKWLLQVVAFVGFYVVTLPSAYSLGFPAKLQQQGLWIGMVIGYVFVSGLYVWVVYRLDWKTASAEAVRISAVVPLVLVDDVDEAMSYVEHTHSEHDNSRHDTPSSELERRHILGDGQNV